MAKPSRTASRAKVRPRAFLPVAAAKISYTTSSDPSSWHDEIMERPPSVTIAGKTAAAEASHRQARRPIISKVAVLLGALIVVASSALFILSYHLGPLDTGNRPYFVFFLAVALMAASYGWATVAARTPHAQGLVVVVAASTACIAHLLRAPRHPFMHDEFGHLYTVTGLLHGDGLFQPNQIVTQSQNYPGFEAALYALHGVIRVAPYHIFQFVFVLLHVGLGLCVLSLARLALGTSRLAVLAAMIFIISPQLIFFDQLFSYESLGLPLAVAAITAAALASRTQHRDGQLKLISCALLISLAAIPVHHLTSYEAIFGLAVIGIAWLLRSDKGARAGSVALVLGTGILAVLAIAWNLARGANITHYLGVYVQSGVDALRQRVFGSGSTADSSSDGRASGSVGQSRNPLSGAHYPLFETAATLITQFVILVLVVAALLAGRKRREPAWWFAVVLTVAYYVTLPLLFSSGSNAAHRSWSFTYVGLAIVASAGVKPLGRAIAKALRRPRAASPSRGPFLAIGSASLMAVLAVGFYGAGVNYLVEIPGPYVVGSDGRSAPPDLYRVGLWIRDHGHQDAVVLSDFSSISALEGVGHAFGNSNIAGLMTQGRTINPYPENVARAFAKQRPTYLVVNSYLSTLPSLEGFYFFPSQITPEPLPRSWLSKFETVPWMHRVYRQGAFTVYRITP